MPYKYQEPVYTSLPESIVNIYITFSVTFSVIVSFKETRKLSVVIL